MGQGVNENGVIGQLVEMERVGLIRKKKLRQVIDKKNEWD